MPNWKKLTALVCLTAGFAGAHLTGESLLPKGGETLKVGESVSITWKVEEIHNKGIDIALSKDGGKTWSNIKAGFNDNANSDTFKWTVPADAVTANGKFRICQSGPCSDANGVSKPSGNSSPWVLVSGAVTIQSASGIATPADRTNALTVDFHPETRNVDVAFEVTGSQREGVLLQAFDTQGRLVATLIEGGYAAGAHNLSVSSNRLGGVSGSMIFKLKVGDRVQTHTWISMR